MGEVLMHYGDKPDKFDTLGDLTLNEAQTAELMTFVPFIKMLANRYVKYLYWSFIDKDDFVQELIIEAAYVIKKGKLAEARNKAAFMNVVLRKTALNLVKTFKCENSKIDEHVESTELAECEHSLHYLRSNEYNITLDRFIKARESVTVREFINNQDQEQNALNRICVLELLSLVSEATITKQQSKLSPTDLKNMLMYYYGLENIATLYMYEIIESGVLSVEVTKDWAHKIRRRLLQFLKHRYEERQNGRTGSNKTNSGFS